MELPLENVKNEVFSVKDEETDVSYGAYPDKRSIEQRIDFGFVLLDKPRGIRSKTASATAKQILSPLGVKKVGYSGTLED